MSMSTSASLVIAAFGSDARLGSVASAESVDIERAEVGRGREGAGPMGLVDAWGGATKVRRA